MQIYLCVIIEKNFSITNGECFSYLLSPFCLRFLALFPFASLVNAFNVDVITLRLAKGFLTDVFYDGAILIRLLTGDFRAPGT